MSDSGKTSVQKATDRLRQLIDELMPSAAPHDSDGAPDESSTIIAAMDASLPPAAAETAPAPAAPPAPAAADHHVAVFAKPHDPHVFAELLCRVLREHPLDALVHARHVPGVLPIPMSESQARELVTLLQGLGLQAAAVNVATLPDLANATVVHHARCRAEGFEIVDLYGATAEVIAWPDVCVVAVGAVPGESLHHYVDASRPALATAAPHAPTPTRLDTHGTDVLELWLLRKNPTGAYCVHHREFNYESLGEAQSESATANFEVFAQQVVNHATAARRTPSTRAFLARDQRLKYAFGSSAELQQHALVQWVIGHCAP